MTTLQFKPYAKTPPVLEQKEAKVKSMEFLKTNVSS